jgi:hypothetical protein
MRFMKTFVMHLYIDLDATDQLCGNLKALPDSKVFSFKNQSELILLLQKYIVQVREKPISAGDLSGTSLSEKHGPGGETS